MTASVMHSFSEIIVDHGSALFAFFVAIVFLGFAAVAALIVFTRWVVHSEVKALTGALHDDVIKISARLDAMIGRKWTDAKLDDHFSDVQSVLNLHDKELEGLRRDHLRFHGPVTHGDGG